MIKIKGESKQDWNTAKCFDRVDRAEENMDNAIDAEANAHEAENDSIGWSEK